MPEAVMSRAERERLYRTLHLMLLDLPFEERRVIAEARKVRERAAKRLRNQAWHARKKTQRQGEG
ncbi:hypothetical protein PPUTLS46_011560 [Pseudomonas putida LS46]|nr:hypothetical protein PPUTLS46_011560 [Pseudomonas putida LS46]